MTAPTPTPDRRNLDRAYRAEVCHLNGGYEVRAGDSRMDARDLFEAFLIADVHNECRRNHSFAVTRRHDGLAVTL